MPGEPYEWGPRQLSLYRHVGSAVCLASSAGSSELCEVWPDIGGDRVPNIGEDNDIHTHQRALIVVGLDTTGSQFLPKYPVVGRMGSSAGVSWTTESTDERPAV
ncbi:hypothetical protein B0H17DRAFT_1195109 [Mycena rosella]|uniref:Uncharacterized protein n=1 Tax=Mycena rosella TaxID=1033263 RepID=A0AAD7DY05_MYCRO|nr:hypothetical protein B0H17DRAFT_1195109 [Mycena rosella]